MPPRIIVAFAVLLGLPGYSCADSKPFLIQVVDDETGRGVPLVELKTVSAIRYFTDSNGLVAFDEPGLMNQRVFFYVQSHGYEFQKDGFGFRGQALAVAPGGRETIKITRRNIAQRLYRITGAGIYRDSVLGGLKPPTNEPLLNAQVFGSDSVENAIFRGKVYWFWGDTNRPSYPLGNFQVPGATSELPGQGGLDPEVGVSLSYFLDDKGFARSTAQMPGEGPTWIHALVVLRDERGGERMFAAYMKVKPPLDVYQQGLVEFDPASSSFKKVTDFENHSPLLPEGRAFVARDGETDYVYFSRHYPLVRVRAVPASLGKPADYEGFTCLKSGSTLKDPVIDRGADGKVRYAWKSDTPVVGPSEQAKLIAARKLRSDEALLQLADRDSGRPVSAHHGSVHWNEFRKRWVLITTESGGKSSQLGEIWYSEADSPLGPWAYAVNIVTHNKYSFYNPKQDPMFDQNSGRTIFFEGTYTHSFSGNPDQTPRYDYNQLMYRLDLDDPRAALPVAIYRQAIDGQASPPSERLAARKAVTAADAMRLPDLSTIAFFAHDRSIDGLVPLRETKGAGARLALHVTPKSEPGEGSVLCYVLPAEAANPPAATVPLFEYAAEDGRRIYSTDPGLKLPEFERRDQPLCRVWRSPWLAPSGA